MKISSQSTGLIGFKLRMDYSLIVFAQFMAKDAKILANISMSSETAAYKFKIR